MSYEYTVSVPANDRRMFRSLAKKMGWSYAPVRNKKVSYKPNSTTVKAMKEAEEGVDLQPLDADHFLDYVASL